MNTNMFRDFNFILEGLERNRGNDLEKMYIEHGKKIVDRYEFITAMRQCGLDQNGEIGELVRRMEDRIKALKIILAICESGKGKVAV